MSAPPPPTLPPLPALFRRTKAQRTAGEVTLVPPLRWHRECRSLETARAYDVSRMLVDDEARSAFQAEQQAATKEKRPRGMAAEIQLRENRPNKPPSQLHREEREELVKEVRTLEAEINALRRRAGLPTTDDMDTVEDVKANNFHVEEKLHQNDRFLGHLHSMATNQLLLPAVNTMSTFIHLPREMKQRRAILRSMQELKLRRGIEVMCAWLHHLDEAMPYLSEESFTSTTGEYHCHRLEIHQFPNFTTARDLYDVYLKFVHDLEFSVTETLGQLTLREDTDDFDPTIWNHRIITVAENVGVPEELDVVGFAQFYEQSAYTNSPMGIVVHDTVNIDELYPYLPDERTCKDVQAVLMVYEVPNPKALDQTIVVIKQASFIVQLTPQFPIEERALKQLQDNSMRWPDSIMKYLHSYATTKQNEAASEETKHDNCL